jgi:hypothetical protein
MTSTSWTRREALIGGAALSVAPLTGGTEERIMIDRPIP